MNPGLFDLRQCVGLILREAKLEQGTSRIDWTSAEALAHSLITALGLKYVDPSNVTTNYSWQSGVGIPVGSIRRMKADVGDLDIISTVPIVKSTLVDIPGISDITGGAKQINFTYTSGTSRRKVNVFVFLDPNSFGAALMHTTGPAGYNVRIRRVAQSKNMVLSQNGLFDSTGKLLAGPTEAAVQAALKISNREVQDR